MSLHPPRSPGLHSDGLIPPRVPLARLGLRRPDHPHLELAEPRFFGVEKFLEAVCGFFWIQFGYFRATRSRRSPRRPRPKASTATERVGCVGHWPFIRKVSVCRRVRVGADGAQPLRDAREAAPFVFLRRDAYVCARGELGKDLAL